MVKKYTTPELEVFYTGYYPDMIEFYKPRETALSVRQGRGSLSKNGKPLQSEGFGTCLGLLLRNRLTLESVLFHIDDIDLNNLQTGLINELMRDYLISLNIEPVEKKNLLAVMEEVTSYERPGKNGRIGRKDFQSRMEELNSREIIQARFIRGDESMNMGKRIVRKLFRFLGVGVLDDLTVRTGWLPWGLVYNPVESNIYFDLRREKNY